MISKMHTASLRGLDEIPAFLSGSAALKFEAPSRFEAYARITTGLRQLGFLRLGRQGRGLIHAYLLKVSGVLRAQLTRLIGQFTQTGRIVDRRGSPAHPFLRQYTADDVRLLADVDALHSTLSGPATRKLCERALSVFGDQRFIRLAGISNGHLHNLRKATIYRRLREPAAIHIPTNELQISLARAAIHQGAHIFRLQGQRDLQTPGVSTPIPWSYRPNESFANRRN